MPDEAPVMVSRVQLIDWLRDCGPQTGVDTFARTVREHMHITDADIDPPRVFRAPQSVIDRLAVLAHGPANVDEATVKAFRDAAYALYEAIGPEAVSITMWPPAGDDARASRAHGPTTDEGPPAIKLPSDARPTAAEMWREGQGVGRSLRQD